VLAVHVRVEAVKVRYRELKDRLFKMRARVLYDQGDIASAHVWVRTRAWVKGDDTLVESETFVVADDSAMLPVRMSSLRMKGLTMDPKDFHAEELASARCLKTE
jgi:hypothetical protein